MPTALVVVALGAPAGAGAAVTRHLTRAGSAAARSQLLTQRDLGRPWSIEAPAERSMPGLSCRGFSPQLSAIVERGAASSPTFGRTSAGPFVSQAAYTWASAAQERLLWRRLVRPHYLRCVSQALARSSGSGAHFDPTSKAVLHLRRLRGLRIAGYRVGGVASGYGQSTPVFLDELVAGRGAETSVLSVASVGTPPRASLERRLLRILVRKLSRP